MAAPPDAPACASMCGKGASAASENETCCACVVDDVVCATAVWTKAAAATEVEADAACRNVAGECAVRGGDVSWCIALSLSSSAACA